MPQIDLTYYDLDTIIEVLSVTAYQQAENLRQAIDEEEKDLINADIDILVDLEQELRRQREALKATPRVSPGEKEEGNDD